MHRLPSSILSLLSSSLLRILFPAVASEPFKGWNRPLSANDESIDSFMSRRFGEAFARTFGSALVHGIYAADSRELSVRAAFPMLWKAEELGWGRVSLGMFRYKSEPSVKDYDLGGVADIVKNASVYSFREGMQALTSALEANLASTANVTIHTGSAVHGIRKATDGEFEVHHGDSKLVPTHIASTLPLPILNHLISSPNTGISIPHLTTNPTSTVRVVNFVFPGPPSEIHPEGFGYLIPRPIDGYSSASSGMLGTVFDSCSLHSQDGISTIDYFTNAPFTKLTIMTGGPYLLTSLPPHLTSSDTPDGSQPAFITSLLAQLETHLGKNLPAPLYWRIWNNEQCIPTLRPGHLDRVQEMKAKLDEALGPDYAGRFALAGAGVGGVSVGDCVEAGKRIGYD